MLCLLLVLAAGLAQAQLGTRLEQASNGTSDAPISAVEWVTTAITAQRGHFVEASSVPYRLVFETLLPGAHRMVIAWDTKASGRHATDYLTHYNRLQPHNQFGAHNVPETIQPLRDISGGPQGPSTFPIPAPAIPGSSFNALPLNQRVFHIYNGTITSATYLEQGTLENPAAETRMAIDFTANDLPVVILFGGHLASKSEWGVGDTAAGVQGLSYRLRLVEFDGLPSLASVVVNAPAVVAPPACFISGPDAVCPRTTNTYTASTDVVGASFAWSLIGNTSGASIVGANAGPTVLVRAGNGGGAYTLQVSITQGSLHSACSQIVTVLTNTSATPLTNAIVCPGGNATFTTEPLAGGPFAFVWRKGNQVISNDNKNTLALRNVTPADAGLYCVEVIGACNSVTNCAVLTVLSNTTATALQNPGRCVGDSAVFVTTASGAGPFTYRWRKNGTAMAGQTNRILTIPAVTFTDAGTYYVEVTGLCGSVTNAGTLMVYGLPPCGIQGTNLVCPESGGNLYLAPTNMAAYYWRVTGNGAIAGPTNQQACVVEAGASGFLTVQLTVVNSNGCSRSCSKNVNVGDIQPPVIVCPEKLETNTAPGQCAQVVDFAVTAGDNCNGATVVCNPPAGSQFLTGTTTVNCTATDGAGNQAGCAFNVTVLDLEAPRVVCPANIVIDTEPGLCEARVTYAATVADNCPGASLTCAPPSGTIFPLGSSSVTCRGNDASGNMEACSFNVTVVDREAPQIICPDDLARVTDPGQCELVVDYDVQAMENCGAATVTCLPPSGSVFPTGTTVVACVATDASTNQSQCSFEVRVDDVENPRIVCPGDIHISTEAGRCDAVVNYILKVSDNCRDATTVCSPPAGARFLLGQTTVTCTATDTSGNSASCTFKVLVLDVERPVLLCPDDLVVNAQTGRCDAVAQYTVSATDNCPGVRTECVPPAGSVFGIGSTVVNCWAIDASSNVVSCAFNVMVEDAQVPVMVCPDGLATNSAPGQCGAVVAYSVSATDNCPGVDLYCEPASGSLFPVGESFVYCVAIDLSGNAQDCWFFVNVNDMESPVVHCPGDLAFNTEPGRCDAVATFNVTATDNCGVLPVVCVPPSGTRLVLGTTAVTCSTRDFSSNAASCTFNVTVRDTEPPGIVCPSNLVRNTAAGRCDAVVDFAPSVTDNCAATLSCVPPSGAVFARGVTPVTCTATDGAGNTNRCTFTVTVNDVEPPVVVCPGPIALNTGPGECDALASFAVNATDNCPGVAVACVPASGTRFPKGITTVICTATDGSGNRETCSFQVNVSDAEPPVLLCPANRTVPAEAGRCDAVVNFAPIVADNCPGVTLVCTPPSGTRFMLGQTPVTCVATDTSGHTNRCSFLVTVNDSQNPTVHCPTNLVVTPEPGLCGATVTFAATVSDNCIGATLTCMPPSGSIFPAGTNVVTCTARDLGGNTAQCAFTVTVADREVPAIRCPANLVLPTEPGRCDALATYALTATDNCPGVAVSCVPPSGGVFAKGTNMVNCTATDASGNTAGCAFQVIVEDREPPALACPANIVTNTQPGRCDAVVSYAAVFSDNCLGATVVCVPPPGSVFATGLSTVVCVATDASGNTNGCTFTVRVDDLEKPVILCPSNMARATEPGRCDAPVTFSVTASDNCNSPSPECIPPSGARFAKGVSTVLCTATDSSGNRETCSFTVTVTDVEPPTIVCPTNQVVAAEAGRCDAMVTFSATITDNCPGASLACVPPSGTRFPAGQTPVSCTVTDASGNTNRCSFLVIVNDLDRPEVSCPANITVAADPGRCDSVVTFAAAVSDNCPGASVLCQPPSGTRFPSGATVVACTGTDAAGNLAACAFTVTVNDLQPPMFECPANIVADTAPGRCDAVVTYLPNVTDNCEGVTVLCQPPSGATFAVGATIVDCLANDASSNTNQCAFTVTVVDRERPAITCPQALELFTAAGQCDAVATFNATATDNCPGLTVVCIPASGSRFSIGITTVTCTATDATTNTQSCSFTVTVHDIEPPILVCPSNIVAGTDLGRCDAVVNFAPSVADDCAGATVVCVPPSGTRFPRGTTLVGCTATDVSSNTVNCGFSVLVEDRESPLLLCASNVVRSADAGWCSAVVTFEPNATDNCPGVEVVCEPPSGWAFPIGTNAVACTAIDAAGNEAACGFTVVVRDDEAPTIVCGGNVATNTQPGQCYAVVDFAPNFADNCAGATVSCEPAAGSPFPKGITTVTCAAIDASGNTASCSFTVTVTDGEPPTATCPANLLLATDPGRCTARAIFAPQVTDNCPGATVQCTPPSGSEFPVGTTSVGCQATDAAGNTRLCAFNVQVVDAQPPQLFCPADLTINTETAQCAARVSYDVSAEDACGLTNLVCVPPSGSVFAKGLTVVQCTAADASGNEATCAFNVTVRDAENPALVCPANIFAAADVGRCVTAVTYAPVFSDNCPGASVLCVPPSGSTFALGITTVTCTAADAAGNTNRCTFTVRVVDNEKPVVQCSSNLVVNCEPNRCDAVVTFATSVTDNCAAMSMSCTPPSGSRFALGTTSVSCMATDAAGNIGTCAFTVRVRDLQNPVVQCPSNIIVSTTAGRCDATVTFSASATDNCGILSPGCSPPSGSLFALGTTIVTCNAVDASSNAGSCQFTVTVRDLAPPMLQCPADVYLNCATGRCDAVASFAPQASDNCSGVNLSCNPPSGATFVKGTNFVTCTARDASSNVVNCTFRVIVRDVEKPNIVCPTNISTGTDPGQCRARVSYAVSVTDNCPGVSVACTPPSMSWFNKGLTAVVCVATDASGNTNRCSFSVTVNDTEPPSIACPANISTNSTHGQASAVVHFVATTSDNCPGVNYVCTPVSGSVFSQGSTPVTCTATDASGNTNHCSFFVTVNDDEPPVINCPTNLIVATSTGRCDAVCNYPVTGADNSQMVTIVCTPPNGSVLPKGLTNVTCIATDPSSNRVSCAFSVNVVDLERPVIACPTNMTAFAERGRCDARATYAASATDNCGNAALTCNPASGTVLPKGTNTVSCTATDTAGNLATCSFTVEVVDNERPLIGCPVNMVVYTPPGQCDVPVTYNASAVDNCPGMILTCAPTSGSAFTKGLTQVNCTARDTSGNTASCSFLVEVRDLESPVLTCPGDIDTAAYVGLCAAPIFYSATVRDNCPGATLTCHPPSGTAFPVGTNSVSCNASDTSGNTAACSFRVVVRDSQRPTLNCPADIILDGSSGNCSPVATYDLAAQDNCPGVTVNCVPPSGSTFPQGTNRVQCTAIDRAGNTANCAFSVIVRLQPVTATQLQSQVVCAGDAVTFSTTPGGSGPLTFTWRKDGSVIAGQSNASLTLPAVTASDAGTYQVAVRGPCSGVTNSATLTVNMPVTVNGLTNVTRCDCDPLILSAAVSGTGPFSYMWRKNGTVLPGAVSNVLSFAKLGTNDAGVYTVEVSGGCNTASRSVTVGVISVLNPAVYTNSGRITIHDQAPAFPYPSAVQVSCVPGLLTRATVTLRGFTHAYPDDADVLLSGPAGQLVALMCDAGDGAFANNINITLDDLAASAIPDSLQLVTGAFRPGNYGDDLDTFPLPAPKVPYQNTLSSVAGTTANGFWSLFVVDDFQLDSGAINNGWVLRLYWETTPIRLTNPQKLANGAVQMTLTGEPQHTYVIQVSTDMASWTPLATLTLSTKQVDFVDPAPPAVRFYRAVEP